MMKIETDHVTGAARIKAPWGDLELSGASKLAVIAHCIKQLEYYLTEGMSPDPRATREDIMGYHRIIETGSESIAEEFFAQKNMAIRSGAKLSNNEVADVVLRPI